MAQQTTGGRLQRWLLPLGIIAFCVTVIAISTGFERMPPILKRGIQPSDFPQLVSGLIIGLTLLMVWREPALIAKGLNKTTWGTLGLLVVFTALLTIDFFLALGIFAGLLSWFWGERRLLVLLWVGFMAPFIVFLLFDLVFDIRFPRGLLTNLWYG